MAGGITSNGILASPYDSLQFAVPLFIIQLFIVLALTRILSLFLRPLREPRVIAEVIGGILLGPTALGQIPGFTDALFPKRSLPLLDSFANFGLIFFLFMVGLELDTDSLKAIGTSALAISGAGMVFPFALGLAVSLFLYHDSDVMAGLSAKEKPGFGPFIVFMGVAMSITAFPVLARILAEFKLLTTEVGGLAMSAAAVDDVMAWILLALAVSLANSSGNPITCVYDLLMGLGFVLFMFLIVKPLMRRMIGQASPGEHTPEHLVAISFIFCLMAAFVTDLAGIHVIFGAFVFGLVLPKDGNFAHTLISKMEDFVGTLLLPLYFVSSGLKTEVSAVNSPRLFGILVLVVLTATVGKVGGVFLAARMSKLSNRKAITFGVLMNTKGLVELIVLNIGLEKKVIGKTLFTIMVLMALVTTFVTAPIISYLTKPLPTVGHGVCTIEGGTDGAGGGSGEFRIFMCAHGLGNIPALVHLSDMSKGRKRKKGLCVYLLHLIEYSERSSALMLVSKARKGGKPFVNKNIEGVDNVGAIFQTYGRLSKIVVKPMIILSGTSDMHEDICSTAAEKQANLIIVPFHKQTGLDGLLSTHVGFHRMNERVLRHAPCSVGVLVDNGLGGSSHMPSSETTYFVTVLFYGGADDREALAYAKRMLEHPNVVLRVVLFKEMHQKETALHISGEGTSHAAAPHAHGGHHSHNSRFHWPGTSGYMRGTHGLSEKDKEAALAESLQRHAQELVKDEAAIASLREARELLRDEDGGKATNASSTTKKDNFIYEESVSTDEVIPAAVRSATMENVDLVIVGRARRPPPILARIPTQDRANRVDAHDLGVIGDALTAKDLAMKASVLVLQQHDPELIASTVGASSKVQSTRAISHHGHSNATKAVSVPTKERAQATRSSTQPVPMP